MKKIFFFGNNLHWETSENLSFLLYTPREERERAANAINIVIVVSMVLYQFKIIFFLSYKCALHIKRLNVDSGSQRREKMAHPVNNAARKYETAKKNGIPIKTISYKDREKARRKIRRKFVEKNEVKEKFSLFCLGKKYIFS